MIETLMAGGRKLLWRLEYMFFRVGLILIENMPLRLAYGLAHYSGLLACALLRKKRWLIYRNLAIAFPQGPPFPTKNFAQAVFINFAKMAVEFLLSRRFLHKNTWRQYIAGGIEELAAITTQHQCAIICTAHLGNFMAGGHLVGYAMGKPITVVMRRHNNPLLTDFYLRLFERSGNHTVPKRGGYAQCKEMVIRGQGYPAFATDQYAGKTAIYGDFFGAKTYTAVGAASLARNFGLPIYLVVVIREPGDRYRFRLVGERIELPAFSEDKSADLEKITQTINRYLEKYILRYPEQWFWMHRRWRGELLK